MKLDKIKDGSEFGYGYAIPIDNLKGNKDLIRKIIQYLYDAEDRLGNNEVILRILFDSQREELFIQSAIEEEN